MNFKKKGDPSQSPRRWGSSLCPAMAAIPIAFLFLLLNLAPFSHGAPTTGSAFSSMFAFGASVVDTGNALTVSLPDLLECGHLPYGMTFFGRPTGRYSDGRLIVDFLAEAFGLPLLPPYLGGGRSFLRGANFAFAGGTAVDASFYYERGVGFALFNNVSVDTQLRWFEELKPSLCGTPQECGEHFSKSLFLVGEFGVNDYHVWLALGYPVEHVIKHVPRVVRAISSAVERLVEHGARLLVVPGIVPTGCTADLIDRYAAGGRVDPATGCLAAVNGLNERHNRLLRRRLRELRAKHVGRATIVYHDMYSAGVAFAQCPRRFGFTGGGIRACCGSGGGTYNFDRTATCGHPGASACGDPSAYAAWDGTHYTEAAYRYMARELLRDLRGGRRLRRPFGDGGSDDDDDACGGGSGSGKVVVDLLGDI